MLELITGKIKPENERIQLQVDCFQIYNGNYLWHAFLTYIYIYQYKLLNMIDVQMFL